MCEIADKAICQNARAFIESLEELRQTNDLLRYKILFDFARKLEFTDGFDEMVAAIHKYMNFISGMESQTVKDMIAWLEEQKNDSERKVLSFPQFKRNVESLLTKLHTDGSFGQMVAKSRIREALKL